MEDRILEEVIVMHLYIQINREFCRYTVLHVYSAELSIVMCTRFCIKKMATECCSDGLWVRGTGKTAPVRHGT